MEANHIKRIGRTLRLLTVIFAFASCNTHIKKEVIAIPEGSVGLIGTGSLTSKEVMASQLGKSYDEPVRIVHVKGYQRVWNLIVQNDEAHPPINGIDMCIVEGDTIKPESLIFLNVEEAESVRMNGCLFIISESDLLTIDSTEEPYERVDVTDLIEEYDIEGGPVYVYKGLPQHVKAPVINRPELNAVSLVYLDILESAFDELGEQYRTDFDKSTVKYHESLVFQDCFVEWTVSE